MPTDIWRLGSPSASALLRSSSRITDARSGARRSSHLGRDRQISRPPPSTSRSQEAGDLRGAG